MSSAPGPTDQHTDEPAAPRTLRGRVWARLTPKTITSWTRRMGLALVLSNILLIVTGGAVRLTKSGLGCPTWPRCTDDSWTNVPEMGIHGFIEFGNRLLTFVLIIVAVLTWLSVISLRRTHRELFWLSTLVALGIPVQAVVGGVTVHTGLNPWVVGVHFILSGIMIGLAAVLYARMRRYSLEAVRSSEGLDPERPEDRVERMIGVGILALGAIAVYLGTLVTGTGPHAGDLSSARHAFDAVMITRMHSVSVWILVVLTVVALIAASRRGWAPAVRRILWLLAASLVVQGAIGYIQYFNGLPEIIVEMHLLGSALVIWVVSVAFDRMTVEAAPTRRFEALSKAVPEGN